MIEEFKNELHGFRADIGSVLADNTLLREENASYRARIEKWAMDMEKWANTKGKPPAPKENTNERTN